MASYWLVPVEGDDPLVIGADRMLLGGGSQPEAFREKLHRLHPRFLPMVKAAILPGEPEPAPDGTGAACGSEEAPPLSEPGPIVYDGRPYGLSECGRAFMDRLPLLREQAEWLALAEDGPAGGWTAQETQWLAAVRAWNESGRRAMLLKED